MTQRAWSVLKQTVQSWIDDYASSMGAALAFYTMFSIAPLILIVLAVSSYFFGADAARGAIAVQLDGLMGREGALAIEGLIKSANEPTKRVAATAIGVIALILGSTSVFSELQNALDRIWRAPVEAKITGIFALVRNRLLSFGMVLGISFLLIVSLVISAALSSLGKFWGAGNADWRAFAQMADFALSFALITIMFALIYKIMPRVSVRWRDVWVGAAVTSLLFTIGKVLIGIYIARSVVVSGFGAAGSLAVLLLWVYYSAQIFLFGAEFTWIYANMLGSKQHDTLAPPGKGAD